MDLAELLRWRKVIPAVMFCAILWPIWHVTFVALAKWSGLPSETKEVFSVFMSAVALPMGVVYHALNTRGLVMRYVLKEFAERIESEMRTSLEKAGVADTSQLASGDKRWMRIFYRQVDADSTIAEVTKQIRDNGLALSSCADSIIIFGFGGLLTLALAFLDRQPTFALWAAFLFVLVMVFALLLPKVKRNHDELMEEQLLHITTFGKAGLYKDYNQMVEGRG